MGHQLSAIGFYKYVVFIKNQAACCREFLKKESHAIGHEYVLSEIQVQCVNGVAVDFCVPMECVTFSG